MRRIGTAMLNAAWKIVRAVSGTQLIPIQWLYAWFPMIGESGLIIVFAAKPSSPTA